MEKGILYHLAWGANTQVRSWPAYFVNGYNFHTSAHGFGKGTMNSGSCVESVSNDFYGVIENIIEVEYPGPAMHVVLFKCLWYDPVRGTNVHRKYNLVEINHKKRYKSYDPFIRAQQAVQVNYVPYPSLKRDRADWLAVCKTRARSKVEEHWKDMAYQRDQVVVPIEPELHDILTLQDPSGEVPTSQIKSANPPNLVAASTQSLNKLLHTTHRAIPAPLSHAISLPQASTRQSFAIVGSKPTIQQVDEDFIDDDNAMDEDANIDDEEDLGIWSADDTDSN
ncbi:hypothetical protein ACH5RR_018048 [Cinchona calisaya]|uniref:DUF4216 domain-containing protein n=1 Tax=Cinchona calisaya TaxID=153742 RepID=A0ABD2ZKB1_9GENT